MNTIATFLTAAEVGQVIRQPIFEVVELCRAGRIPATQVDGQWLIAAADLEALLAANHNRPEQP